MILINKYKKYVYILYILERGCSAFVSERTLRRRRSVLIIPHDLPSAVDILG